MHTLRINQPCRIPPSGNILGQVRNRSTYLQWTGTRDLFQEDFSLPIEPIRLLSGKRDGDSCTGVQPDSIRTWLNLGKYSHMRYRLFIIVGDQFVASFDCEIVYTITQGTTHILLSVIPSMQVANSIVAQYYQRDMLLISFTKSKPALVDATYLSIPSLQPEI